MMKKPLVGHWRSLYVRQKGRWLVVGYVNMESGEIELQRQRVYTPRAENHPWAGHYMTWSWEE